MKKSLQSFFLLMTFCITLNLVAQEDMQQYLRETKSMIKQQQYPEALERCIWFHNHALKYNKHMGPVRVSFALGYWKDLADAYPPAMEALIAIRDSTEAIILSKKFGQNRNVICDLFADVKALNRTLEEDSKTVTLFEFIQQYAYGPSQSCWIYAKDVLFEAERYDLIKHYIKNPLQEFDLQKKQYEYMKALDEQRKTNLLTDTATFSITDFSFIQTATQLIQLALANQDIKAALSIERKAGLTVPHEIAYKALAEAVKQKVGNGSPFIMEDWFYNRQKEQKNKH